MTRRLRLILLSLTPLLLAATASYDEAPIHYSATRPADPVTDLQERLAAGDARLPASPDTGLLLPLLRELNVPVSSQTLVFSKTSLQRNSISPSNPRAIYFNDDTYVGYVPGGRVIEIATTDPRLGTTFYTIDQHARATRAASLVRQTDNCLQCHASAMTRDVPGLMVRSVHPDSTGEPILPAGTFVTTHESPMNQRWGGWYVTSPLPGDHMANRLYDDSADPSSPKPLPALDPARMFNSAAYPSPHSDPVALLVLEHQVEAHNRLTRASHASLKALHDEAVLAKAMGETLDPNNPSASTRSRIKNACEPLVEYLLYSGEPALPGPVTSPTSFTKDFSANGPRDPQGRSLRDLDLQTRLFKHPCSYLIYSDSFNALPTPALDYIYHRLHAVLTGQDTSKPFAHLTPADRQAILEILRTTKKALPPYFDP